MNQCVTQRLRLLSLCGELMPSREKTFCTVKDPDHKGDHVHEYSALSWSRTEDDAPAKADADSVDLQRASQFGG